MEDIRMNGNSYGVKVVYRYTAGKAEFYEESVLHVCAADLEAACEKAEQYAAQCCGEWTNVQGETVRQEIAGMSSYYGTFPENEDDSVLEVFSRFQKAQPSLPDLLLSECNREDMLPLRRWRDPAFPDEFDTKKQGS